MPQIDFAGLAARLLTQAETLVPQWLPGGKRRGHEWVCGNLRGDPGTSCSINLSTGHWADFADDTVRGGDLISLYAAIHNTSQKDAATELSPDDIIARATGHASPAVAPVAAKPVAVPAPEDAVLPPPPRSWGEIRGEWRYYLKEPGGPVFVIRRFDPPGERKQFLPYTWREGKWERLSYPAPRPIYRLREILARADAEVLIVEGEKACEAAVPYLPDLEVTTWAGGAAVPKSADWSVLRGRRVVIWPDADEPGSKAAAQLAPILLGLGCRVRVLKVTGKPEGWDIVDAINTDDWSTAQLIEFMAATAVDVAPPPPAEPAKKTAPNVGESERASKPKSGERAPIKRGRIHDGVAPVDIQAGESSGFVRWGDMGLDCNSGGVPHPTLANASLIFQRHPDVAGRIWFDTFRGQMYHRLYGDAEVPWADHDDLNATAWLQQQLKLPKIGVNIVRDAVMHAARRAARNSLHTWLESLEWDHTPRLVTWLQDCLDLERSPYTEAISRNWALAMIARAYEPGCKMDNMPVLEGRMGRGKSTFLEMLGSPWYASLPDDFGGTSFLQAIQGRWLIEVPDMTGFSKREHGHILAIITRRNDPYRRTWGRHVEDHPRVSMFAATSETDDYLQDSRGIRRYWPVRCKAINLDVLEAQREQIFAEALVQWRLKATWHIVPTAETEGEQKERITQDPWQRRIELYLKGRREAQIEDILSDPVCINMLKERQTRREVLRVAAILRDIGWRKARPRDAAGHTYAAWVPDGRSDDSLDSRRAPDDFDFDAPLQ